MGREVAQQPNGKWAMISTVTDTFCALDMTKDEIIESICLSRIRQLEKEIAELKAHANTFFDEPGRVVPWDKAVKWQWFRECMHGRGLDTWKYIKENVDPTVDDIVSTMEINEDGEWVN